MEIELDVAARAQSAIKAAADLLTVAGMPVNDYPALYNMAAIWLLEEHERLENAIERGLGQQNDVS